MRDYALLIFEPDIRGTFDHTTALWKGQIDSKKNYNSINLVLINDNIEINNRRPLSSWLKFLSDNSVKYEYIYNSEFAVSLRILDSFDKTFEFQLLQPLRYQYSLACPFQRQPTQSRNQLQTSLAVHFSLRRKKSPRRQLLRERASSCQHFR